MNHPPQKRKPNALFAPLAVGLLAPLTGCMGSSPQMVNVDPSYVHERYATEDDRVAAAWPVMPTQQAMAERRASVAELAYLER